MTIWILAFLLFGLLAYLGYLQGAIRGLVGLTGVILGVFLAIPLSGPVKPLFPLIGVQHAVWNLLLPPLLIFVLFLIVFTIIAFIAHQQVNLHFKYKTDDVQYLRWERLNKRMGVCLGLITGAAYLFLAGVLIYKFGYVTVQVATAENVPAPLKFLNRARADMQETGFEKIAAKLDRTSATYYEAADLLGLVYHNPLLHSRLTAYPAFFSMGQRAEFTDIASDNEYLEMLQRQESITQIINNPKTQTVLNNADIMAELNQIDLKDLNQFLRTGKSEKFDPEKILGRWQLDAASTLTEIRKSSPNLSGTEWNNLKRAFSLYLTGMTLRFAPDGRVFIKAKPREEIPNSLEAPVVAAQAASGGVTPPTGTGMTPGSLVARSIPSGTDAMYQQRYGIRPGIGTTPPAYANPAPVAVPAAAAPVAANPALKYHFVGEGAWKNEGGAYSFSVQEQKIQASFKGDTLVLGRAGLAMLFEKQ